MTIEQQEKWFRRAFVGLMLIGIAMAISGNHIGTENGDGSGDGLVVLGSIFAAVGFGVFMATLDGQVGD